MRFDWLLPSVDGIPVLMYHRVWPGQSDGLTLTPEQLREQWTYLKESGYQALSLPQFLDIATGAAPRPRKAVLITFDDGYHNNLTHVYPLLQELGWCATIFIIADTIDGTAPEDPEEINWKLSLADLQLMDKQHVQYGLHGYHHENFSETELPAIKKAILDSFRAFEDAGLRYLKVLAYPYGRRPQDKSVFKALKSWMKDQGMKACFRIGNKPADLPARDPFDIKRIDIRGGDTLADFKIKLRKGKLKPF